MSFMTRVLVGMLVLVCVWAASLTAFSQGTGMMGFVVGRHPRIHLGPADAPAGIPTIKMLRARLASGDEKTQQLYRQVLARADHRVWRRGDDRVVLSDRRAQALGLAYHLTGDDKYFQAAKRHAFVLTDDPHEWLNPTIKLMGMKSDLVTGRYLRVLGLVYDWFYDQFTPEERTHLTTAMRERGFKLWLQDKCALTQYTSNWCTVVAGGVGIAAMATLEDIPESRELAALAAEHVPQMLGAFRHRRRLAGGSKLLGGHGIPGRLFRRAAHRHRRQSELPHRPAATPHLLVSLLFLSASGRHHRFRGWRLQLGLERAGLGISSGGGDQPRPAVAVRLPPDTARLLAGTPILVLRPHPEAGTAGAGSSFEQGLPGHPLGGPPQRLGQ